MLPPLRVAAPLLSVFASTSPDADKAALLAFLSSVGRGATARARINWPTIPLACASPVSVSWIGSPAVWTAPTSWHFTSRG
jgi:hypothetical protein